MTKEMNINTIHSLDIHRILRESPEATEVVRIIGIVGPEFTQNILKEARKYMFLYECGCKSNDHIHDKVNEQMLLETGSPLDPVAATSKRNHLSIVHIYQ